MKYPVFSFLRRITRSSWSRNRGYLQSDLNTTTLNLFIDIYKKKEILINHLFKLFFLESMLCVEFMFEGLRVVRPLFFLGIFFSARATSFSNLGVLSTLWERYLMSSRKSYFCMLLLGY